MTRTFRHVTGMQDTLDYTAHHARSGTPHQAAAHSQKQQLADTCAPKQHSKSVFSALKRHLLPNQVLTGNAFYPLRTHIGLTSTKINDPSTAQS